jgi:hypothetical protein
MLIHGRCGRRGLLSGHLTISLFPSFTVISRWNGKTWGNYGQNGQILIMVSLYQDILDFGLCFMCVWNKSVWFKGKTRRKLMDFFHPGICVMGHRYVPSKLSWKSMKLKQWLAWFEWTYWKLACATKYSVDRNYNDSMGWFQILPPNSQTNRWESKQLWEWPQPLSLSLGFSPQLIMPRGCDLSFRRRGCSDWRYHTWLMGSNDQLRMPIMPKIFGASRLTRNWGNHKISWHFMIMIRLRVLENKWK